ncbi:MAG: Flp pilus assembly complex ATPase component TadA, partial [Pontiellaceae bacterium]|nr:Flp pilus assembly complex ATPase component TadA [Pontiellaceae bacterium]
MSSQDKLGHMDRFHAHLLRMDELKASDLFLRADISPGYRINGSVVTTSYDPLSESELRSVIETLATPLALERFKQSGDLDFAYAIAGAARYRINIFLHSGRIGLVARLIPLGHIAFDKLGLPSSILDMASANSGLILAVGPTGCGKSTTLASLIHHINAARRAHIMTIEDPVEFVHEEINCLVHQRQVGYDTQSFSVALKHVVRQSPDVIMIGELRDRDAMQTALSAALSGHLILSTV